MDPVTALSLLFIDAFAIKFIHVERLGGEIRVHYQHYVSPVYLYSVSIDLLAYTVLLLAAYNLPPLENPVVLVRVDLEEPAGWYVATNLTEDGYFLREALCTDELSLLKPEFVIKGLEFLYEPSTPLIEFLKVVRLPT